MEVTMMKQFVNWLRALGAEVDEKNGEWGSLTVNGMKVTVEAKKVKGGKEYLEFAYGVKKSSSAKNSAVWLLADYLPALQRNDEVASFADTLKAALAMNGSKVELWLVRADSLTIRFKSLDELKNAVKLMSKAVE